MIAGALLCFIPIVGEFVIPDLLGGSQTLMIGQTLWTEFFANKDWPVASAVAVVLLCLLVVPIVIYQHMQARVRSRRTLTMRKVVLVQYRLGRARAGVPLSADRHPGDLFVQRLAARHRLGRLVDALVRRAAQRSRHARCRLGHAAHRRAVRDARRPCSARSRRIALVRFGRFRGRVLFSGMIYAPLVMPEVITGLSLLLLFVAVDIDRGFWTVTIAHTTLTAVLRHRGGAVAAR